MNISVNVRKDLLVANMLIYLFSEANSKETRANSAVVSLHNKTHKVNSKIKEINDNMLIKLKATIDKIHTEASNRLVVVKWCDARWESKDVSSLFNSIRETNFEFLANQIIYHNFIERKQPLHKELKWLADAELNTKTYDLLETTNAELILETIYYDSLRVVKILKGLQ